MPRKAIGITGTGRAARMRSTPGRKRWISPSRVMPPSGKIATRLPAASSRSTSANARSIISGSSFFPAIGIARAARNSHDRPNHWKILKYMTKRIGRRTVPATISGSMKLTWLQTISAGPSSGTFSRPFTRRRYSVFTSSHDRNRIRNSGTSV